jgi:hypothetical protein
MSETTTTMTDPLGWNSTTWDTLKQAVHEETQRTKILPLHGPMPDALNVPSDITEEDRQDAGVQ